MAPTWAGPGLFKSIVQQIRLFRPMDDVINKLISSSLANFLKRSIFRAFRFSVHLVVLGEPKKRNVQKFVSPKLFYL